MAVTKINVNGINELDFPSSTTATVSSPGVISVTGTGDIVSYVAKNGSYALQASDYAVAFTATATATLPAGMTKGKMFRIKLKGTGLTLTVNPESGLIDDAANAIMTINNEAIDVIFDGTNWQVF